MLLYSPLIGNLSLSFMPMTVLKNKGQFDLVFNNKIFYIKYKIIKGFIIYIYIYILIIKYLSCLMFFHIFYNVISISGNAFLSSQVSLVLLGSVIILSPLALTRVQGVPFGLLYICHSTQPYA